MTLNNFGQEFLRKKVYTFSRLTVSHMVDSLIFKEYIYTEKVWKDFIKPTFIANNNKFSPLELSQQERLAANTLVENPGSLWNKISG